jgi:glycosyltransferase involved in cell wall biosynthesis
LFGDDVRVVPRKDPGALAGAISRALSDRRRTRTATADTIDQRFRPEAVAREYWQLYADAVVAKRPLPKK